jgi:hypothetical protein
VAGAWQSEGSCRARSISAGPLAGSLPSTAGSAMTPRVVGTPLSLYGNRFSAVTSGTPVVPLLASSRNTMPQPMAGGRFVPVIAQGYVEAQRGRESSLGPGPNRAPSVSTRGGSPPPGVGVVAPTTGVVRQSSVQRPMNGVVRQASGRPVEAAGSCTPITGASVQTVGGASGASCTSSAAGPGEDSVPPPLAGPNRAPLVAPTVAGAAARNLQGNSRFSLGPGVPGTSTPQPSRYAYVNSAARRDAAASREVQRRGRR